LPVVKRFGTRSNKLPKGCLYIVAGPDELFRRRAVEAIIEGDGSRQKTPQSVRRLSLAETTLSEILVEVQMPSLFAAHGVVVADRAETAIRKQKDVLVRLSQRSDLPETLVLTTQESPNKLGLKNGLGKGVVIECYELWPSDVGAFVATEARHWKKTIDADAIASLAWGVGADASALAGELEKLALYVGKRRKITIDDVDALVGGYRTFAVFELVGHLVKCDAPGALRATGRLREAGIVVAAVVGALSRVLRRVMGMKRLLSQGMSAEEAASALGIRMKSDKMETAKLARSADTRTLENAFCTLAKADVAFKQGEVSDETALEELVVRLTRDLMSTA